MKKIFILLCFLFTACQPFDWDAARGDIAKNALKREYSTAFNEEFGTYGSLQIDQEHTWGFYDILQYDTRGANVNANQWFDFGLDVPEPLTQAQIDIVTNWFSSHQNPNGIAVNWTEYFAQQVSSTDNGRHMDYLIDASQFGTNNHINNFNSGDCSYTNVGNRYQDKIMFMTGQSTKDFAYHETVSDITWYNHYVIIPGEVIDSENTYGLHGMYFVGFDYEAAGQSVNQIIQRDYYFNDWIIKISPGLLTKPEPVRIMAEDLGAIGDFDFNDVVFDVYIKYNQWYHGDDYGVIVLQAAGGTMPLYVNDKEVHQEFGVPTTQIVNTRGSNSVNRPKVIWSFIPETANPIDIHIIVYNTKENINYEIGSEVGVAPGKFAVPVGVNWSPECVNIKITYPKFVDWVEDQNKHFWE